MTGLARGRQRRVLLWVVVTALLAGTFALTEHRLAAGGCAGETVRSGRPSDPLMTPVLMDQRPEKRRDTLVRAMARLGPPFGEILAGVDYNYGQWLHLYGVQGGVLAWTKRNKPVTFLAASDLAPRWSLRPATDRVAFDASPDRFVLLGLSKDDPTTVASFDLRTGQERWCRRLETSNRDGDVLSTAVLPDDSVVVAAGSGRSVRLDRLDARTGRPVWSTSSHSVDRADHVGLLGDDLLVVGGREEFRLRDPRPPSGTGPAVTALAVDDGRVAWTWAPSKGSAAHVVGEAPGRVVVLEAGAESRLVGLGRHGAQAWATRLPDHTVEATVRDDTVLVETRTRFVAFATGTGKRRWSWDYPRDRTFIPYGFTLGQMPALDAHTLLMPTTFDLRELDVRTGVQRAYAMPTDGISTTYWPYQLLATDKLLGVVTNTGAVVLRRTS